MTIAPHKRAVNREILHLILPMIVENILQISAGLISTAMIGRLLASDVSSQGICIRITDTLWCLYKGISVGATIMIARSYGAGNREHCRHVAEQTFLTEVPLGLLFSVLLTLLPMPVLSFFTTDGEVLAKAAGYMQIIVWGFPFVVIMSVVTASFQGCGDTRTPMLIAVVVNLINIGFGWLFIFGLGLGIRGAAAALVLSQVGGALLGLVLLYRKGGLFGGAGSGLAALRVDRECVVEVYATGLPAAFESMFWQFSAILLSKMILGYGQTAFAAYQIGIQAETITEMPAIGFGTAATTLIARAIGRGDDELRRDYFGGLLGLSTKISVVTSLLLILLPGVFMSLMTTNETLRPIGITYVFIMGFIQIPQNLSRIFNGALRAAGYRKAPMLVAGFGIWIVRIPLCFLVSTVLHADITWIWIIIAIDQISRFLLSVGIYRYATVRGRLVIPAEQ